MKMFKSVDKSTIVTFSFIIVLAFGLCILDNQHTKKEKQKLENKIENQRQVIEGLSNKYWKAVRDKCELESI